MVNIGGTITELEEIVRVIANNKPLKSALSKFLCLFGIFCFASGLIIDGIEPEESPKCAENNDESAS